MVRHSKHLSLPARQNTREFHVTSFLSYDGETETLEDGNNFAPA